MFLRSLRPRPSRATLVSLLSCLGLALIGALLAFPTAPALDLAVRPYDQNFLRGVNAIETISGVAGRWTREATALRLPSLGNGTTILALSLLNSRPDGQPDPTVKLALGTHSLTVLHVARSSGQARHFKLLLPSTLAAWLDVQLASDTISLAGDPRQLGVVFQRAQLTATTGGLRVPPPLSLAILVALACFSYGGLRGAGLRDGVALSLTGLISVGVSLGIALRPLDVLPFLMRLSALAGLACAAIWLARLVAPPARRADLLLLRRADLPIYLGLAWWTMPLYQLVLTFDGAPNVTPHPLTSLLGAVTALAALVAFALRGVITQRGWTYRQVFIAILLGGSLAHTLFLIGFAFTRSGPDFWIYFRAVRSFVRDGLPLYNPAELQVNHFGYSFKWPPLYPALLSPFTWFDGLTVLLGHRIVNTVLLGLTAVLLVRQAPSWPLTVTILMLFNFRPATDTLAFGQVDLELLFGATLALLAILRGRNGLAGAIVAFFALLKLYPALLFGFFLVQRRWRSFGGAILAGLVCTAIIVAVFGWATPWIFLTQVIPIIGGSKGSTPWIENQTFSGFFSRFFAPEIVSVPFSTPLLMLATYAFFGITLLVALGLAARREQTPLPHGSRWQNATPLQFSLFLLLTVLAVPAAWMHYQTVTILLFAAIVLHGTTPLPLSRVIALAAAYALIAYGNPWSFTDSTMTGGLGVLGYSYKFYGLLLLFGVSVAELWRDVAPVRLYNRRKKRTAMPPPMGL